MQGMNIQNGKPISGVAHLKQSITNILTTPRGSRIMRREYGSNLFNRIDNPINGELIANIYSDVVEAIFNFEPRFEVSNITVDSVLPGKIILSLEGTYLPTNESLKIENITITKGQQ